jgi:hypothetical protein
MRRKYFYDPTRLEQTKPELKQRSYGFTKLLELFLR